MAGTLQISWVLFYSDSVPICLYLLSPWSTFPIDPGQTLVMHTPGTVNHSRERRRQDINWCQFTGVFLYMHLGCSTHTHTHSCAASPASTYHHPNPLWMGASPLTSFTVERSPKLRTAAASRRTEDFTRLLPIKISASQTTCSKGTVYFYL